MKLDLEKVILIQKKGFITVLSSITILGSNFGITMDKIEMTKNGSGTWVQGATTDFSFYTGVLFINKIRFSNDNINIWEANSELVTDRLKEIETDFDASVLTDEEN